MSEMFSEYEPSLLAESIVSREETTTEPEGVTAQLAAVEPEGTALSEALKGQLAQARGLCANCANDVDCRLPRNAAGPVFYCEQYEVESVQTRPLIVPAADVRSEAQQPSPLLGLCVNCEVRAECKFPKPEGGVWCCEEYQ